MTRSLNAYSSTLASLLNADDDDGEHNTVALKKNMEYPTYKKKKHFIIFSFFIDFDIVKAFEKWTIKITNTNASQTWNEADMKVI